MGTARWCVACGTALQRRPLAEIQAELAHVRFLLAEMQTWQQVTPESRGYLYDRYQRQERVLLSAITEMPPPARPSATREAGAARLPSSAAPIAGPLQTELQPSSAAPVAGPEQTGRPSSPPSPIAAEEQTGRPSSSPSPVAAEEQTALPPSSPSPIAAEEQAELPLSLEAPVFDIPHTPTATEQIIEEASTWSRVWRPFLAESVGWFIGAFLILAGTFFGVAESWQRMSSTNRGLVVFAIAAGWSAGFALWGWYLGRRETTRSAARVLGLIAAIISPLAAIALQSLAPAVPLLFWPLLVAWSVGAALLAKRPARSYDEPSRPLIQVGIAATTALMGAAPLLARGGSPMLWLDFLPVALLWAVLRPRADGQRSNEQLAYVLLAPAYLAALFGIRLHLALSAAGAMPPLGTYAPFLAALAGCFLRARARENGKAADALSIAVVTCQSALVAFAVLGEAPAFFATALIAAFTTWRLSRKGPVRRAGWLYAVYAFGYLAYQSCGQLVPGVLKALLDQVKAQLGYSTQPLPFTFNAVYAALFVVTAAFLAGRRSAHKAQDPRAAPESEALLRSTAVASGLFSLMAVMGTDPRPGVWAIPVFAALCLGLGLWQGRSYLTLTGAVLTLLLDFSLIGHFGPVMASVVVAAMALVLAIISVPLTQPSRRGLGLVVALHAFLVAALAWSGAPTLAQPLALVLAGAAGLLVAFNEDEPVGIALVSALAASGVPRLLLVTTPPWAPAALAGVALALALLADRGGRLRLLALTSVGATLVAVPWQIALQVHSTQGPHLLGVVLLSCAAAAFVCSRKAPAARPLGVLLVSLALLPAMGAVTAWPWLTPVGSAWAFVAVALAASIWTGVRGPSLTPTLFACFTLTGGLVAAGAGELAPEVLAPAALGALLSARALHPSFSVPYAALLACAALLQHRPLEPWLFFGIAAALAAISLLEEWDFPWASLLGRRQVALAASLSSLAVALLVSVLGQAESAPQLWQALLLVLPLVWVRATRSPLLIFPLLPLAAAFAESVRPAEAVPWLVPALALVLTRLAAHLPAAGNLLFGAQAPPRKARRFSQVLLVSLAVTGGAMTTWGGPHLPWLGYALALAFVLAAGEPLFARLGMAALFFVAVPQSLLAATGLFVCLAFAAHHAPRALHRALGADENPLTAPVAVIAAILLSTLRWTLFGADPASLAVTAGCLFIGALLLSRRWLLTAAVGVAAAAPLTARPQAWLAPTPEEALLLVIGALAAAVAAAVLRHRAAQTLFDRVTRAISPGLGGPVGSPLWLGATLVAAVALASLAISPGVLPSWLLVACAVALMVTPRPVQAAVATGLLGAALALAVPNPWAPAAIALAGALVCLAGHLAARHPTGEALHHSGWVLALLALLGLHQLGQPVTSLTVAGAAAAAWAVAWRRRSLEPVAWVASLVAAHVTLFYLGEVFSTGKPPAFILPYLAAASALLAVLAGWVAGAAARRAVGLGFGLLSLLEASSGLVLIGEAAPKEAWVCGLGLAVLFVALVQRALSHDDEAAAYLAQVALGVAYLVVRVLGMGGPHLSGGDALVGLVAGALFSGLHGWAQREGQGRPVLVGPSLLGAYFFPGVGLLVAPWSDPWQASLLLAAHAAHFAAMARKPSQRQAAALLSALAFNAALVCTWLASGRAEPQYFVIPAGISLLVLVRVFRAELSPLAQARLRALAITIVYAAGAWKPLTFAAPWAMPLCALVCVVGVALGVALRIRSFIYLGTAFLVTTVLANLIRYGVRDPRLGALFLSALGLTVVAFMVLLSTRREDLLRRYLRTRELLQQWEG